VEEARRLIDICLDAGITLFDTADVYSNGASEERLGAAIKARRDRLLISTKTSLPMGDGPDDAGSSRQTSGAGGRCLVDATWHRSHRSACSFTPSMPARRSMRFSTPSTCWCRAGKVNYVGVSNFSGWHLMKSLGIAAQNGWPRYAAHQVYYSLVGRTTNGS